MTDEARIEETETGRRAANDGWFILNLGEMRWETLEGGGIWSSFEPPSAPSPLLGIGVHILHPGEAPGFYHEESNQEGFLVLSGECIAVVEGQERRMGPWDYLHCPPGTRHITIGVSAEPCAILMVGTRTEGKIINYPADPVAAAHGASVRHDAGNARDAYAQWDGPRTFTRVAAPWPPAPSAV
jgi:uncharacterized cupin superfamily protein